MYHKTLHWHGPCKLADLVTNKFKQLPKQSGVYVFTEYDDKPLEPNPLLLVKDDKNYESQNEKLRGEKCVLYVGMAGILKTRVRGYLFKPYLEIMRRSGPPRHEADPHKGRALLHAHQYYAYEKLTGSIFLWWAETKNAGVVETALIRELNPVLNTRGLVLHHSDEVKG
jgi:hypothetical protein